MNKPSIHWFRLDFRLADNPSLRAAMERGGPVVPVFIWGPDEEGDWPPGAASRWWLHQSLSSLDPHLREVGSCLVVRRGSTLAALRALAKETGANAVFWNRRYEPAVIARDAKVKESLRAAGIEVTTDADADIATTRQPGKPVLYRLENDKLVPVSVRTGIADASFTEIIEGGIKEGDKLVVRETASKDKSGSNFKLRMF